MTAKIDARNTAYVWAAGIALVALAFIGAHLTADSGWLSLTPKDAGAPAGDTVSPENAVTLYQSVYTAWAAVLMTAPAMATVWMRNRSEYAARWWRLYWTAALAVFLVHLLWAMAVFYEGKFDAMRETARVSAFWPGLIFTAWWVADVILAWTTSEDRKWITIQRVLVHIIAFVMFTVGSLVQGEVLIAQVIGGIFVIATIYGGARWSMTRGEA